MGKRSAAEIASHDEHTKKRSRKKKSDDKDIGNGGPEDTQLGEERSVSKKARKAEKEAKREAKRLKRAQKQSKRAAVARESGLKGSTHPKDALTPPDKVAKKASRKAEDRRSENNVHGSASAPDGAEEPQRPLLATSSKSTGKLRSAASYSEHPDLTSLPEAEIQAFLASNYIAISDPLTTTSAHRPIVQFSHLPLDAKQRSQFATFTSPTPIQAAAWPALFAGRDMIGIAETGSGKTLAFGVPCIRRLSSSPEPMQAGARALIVSPTRELASQIHEQLEKFASSAGLEVACVYGGVPKEPQMKALKTAQIVVATPGRLSDLMEHGSADISAAEYVVLDEADRMLDKGFEEAIRHIVQQTPSTRQTLMFTATWPPSIRELAETFMRSPVKVSIGDNPAGELRANARITQLVEVVDPWKKEARLFQLLKQYHSGKHRSDRILIFCLYKKEAMRVETTIRQRGFQVVGIHGDLSQAKRTESLESFKRGLVPLLVATDVAARGLDIPAVKLIINYTFPLTAEDYVHRIGRTGRAGKDGLAITLFTENEKGLAGA